jgi:Tfp pilus assembly protein PilP
VARETTVTRRITALTIGFATTTLLTAGVARAQAPSVKPAQPGTPATATAANDPQAPPAPTGYSYNPEGRRDPFVSLVRRGTDAQRPDTTVRLPGLAGMMAAEVTLKGTMQTTDGFVALLKGVDNKTYIVRPGDKLLDGTIRAIDVNAMVILQQVNDPLSLEKQREVRKVLRQAEEVK